MDANLSTTYNTEADSTTSDEECISNDHTVNFDSSS